MVTVESGVVLLATVGTETWLDCDSGFFGDGIVFVVHCHHRQSAKSQVIHIQTQHYTLDTVFFRNDNYYYRTSFVLVGSSSTWVVMSPSPNQL